MSTKYLLIQKRRRRLGADRGIGDPIDKPKGMRWATSDRKMDQVEAAEAICDARLLRFIQKIAGKYSCCYWQ